MTKLDSFLKINLTRTLADRIKGFEYDGAGPDAFFWAGTSGAPSSVGIILPFPFDGKFYDYEDKSAPVLGRFEGVSSEHLLEDVAHNLQGDNSGW